MNTTQDYFESDREREEGHVDTRKQNFECEDIGFRLLAFNPLRNQKLSIDLKLFQIVSGYMKHTIQSNQESKF